jgi:uncharacterized membrane protein
MTETRTRLDQPVDERRRTRFRYDAEAFGRSTERIARFLGTGRYLVIQTAVILAWVIENAIPGIPHFDGYPFLFLTLGLSLQAAYAAPLILLAQNRQDDRDRINLDADRGEARESKADLDYLAREIAAIRMALGEVATRDFLRSELIRAEAQRDSGKEAKEKKERKDKEVKDAKEAKDAKEKKAKDLAAAKPAPTATATDTAAEPMLAPDAPVVPDVPDIPDAPDETEPPASDEPQ